MPQNHGLTQWGMKWGYVVVGGGGGGGGLMRFDSKSHLGIVLDAYKRDSD